MIYNRCGRSGVKLPAVSLGLWHNFGGVDRFEACREIILFAFDSGITHFDLANNYGPPPGSAEETFGRILEKDFKRYRDELFISTKAGYDMWLGPYGEWGSKKYLTASLDQSLKRMGLDYVDLFYSHRLDPDTPLEETMEALYQSVQQGKALYVGISNYPPAETKRAAEILRGWRLKCLIHQPKYSMLNRWIEGGLLDVLGEEGIGCIPFSPLAQGLLTDRYASGIPDDSRAGKPHGYLRSDEVSKSVAVKVSRLSEIAHSRGQTLAQMALAWVLRDSRVTSVLIGVSRREQLAANLETLRNLEFGSNELSKIDEVLSG
jgi:L-glyceraldehyde 3-phosphate reductase